MGPNRIEFVVHARRRDRPEGGILLAKLAVIPSDEDAQDVTLAADGDQAAFERLYRRHVPRVTSLARWLGDPADVDDAVQEIFLRVWQKLHTFAGQAAFSTWLHRVAVNLLVRRRERTGIRQRRESQDETPLLAAAAPRERPDLRVAIERAVERLPAGARDVFVLHDMEGYKHEEIGRMLGVDPGTSRSQLHRARLLLREQLTA
jgi:RNA polymerase sigma-70 factor (ECF subfamily)